MTNRFNLKPREAKPAATDPMSATEFVERSAMIQSQSGSRPAKPVRINFDLTPDLHRRIKRRALDLDVSVADYVRTLITKDLDGQ